MDAIDMLKKQHREVEKLFKKMAETDSTASRREIFEDIADALAVHATIEERHFYPSVKRQATEDLLLESVEEHLEIKRAIADLLELDAGDRTFDAKVKVLQEDVEGHVNEEESDLFPKVRRLFDDDAMDEIARAMEETQTELLSRGHPRDAVPSETAHAAPL